MNKETLPEQIKKLRSSKKMTLAVMAERIGVSASAIAAYENGSRTPSLDVLVKMARLFNVTTDNLLGCSNKDLIDVSELCLSQRENVRSLILTYKKFNVLAIRAFGTTRLPGLCDDEDIESYFTDSFDSFLNRE